MSMILGGEEEDDYWGNDKTVARLMLKKLYKPTHEILRARKKDGIKIAPEAEEAMIEIFGEDWDK